MLVGPYVGMAQEQDGFFYYLCNLAFTSAWVQGSNVSMLYLYIWFSQGGLRGRRCPDVLQSDSALLKLLHQSYQDHVDFCQQLLLDTPSPEGRQKGGSEACMTACN